ncbi:hypothetical protein FGO68_gene1117 [Halteria grandinella]|uniref:Uncharacterized protein n=1 Tax=Halteria grandinella TaxID=5974 RepID=A0A8J8N9D2_HALGN|nr:hypothetical protein FGO68_gene1117 [Halteria grandinella]
MSARRVEIKHVSGLYWRQLNIDAQRNVSSTDQARRLQRAIFVNCHDGEIRSRAASAAVIYALAPARASRAA